MRVRVRDTIATPAQTVSLDLSVEEFALLKSLVWRYLDGTSVARSSIQDGFGEALWKLHPDWRVLVGEAVALRDKSNLAEKVSSVFS